MKNLSQIIKHSSQSEEEKDDSVDVLNDEVGFESGSAFGGEKDATSSQSEVASENKSASSPDTLQYEEGVAQCP